MNDASTQSEIDELREKILAAARIRFMVYGYGKTTMAEIAEDCAMSAANLYRYFHNKQDIAGECADRCMCERSDRIRQVIRQGNMSAAERLHAFVQEAFRFNLEMAKDSPKLNELIEFVSEAKKEVVHDKINVQVSLIAEILAHGNETGEFDVSDVVTTARTVYTAMVLYDVPTFLALFPVEEFELMAKNTVNLLIKGLRKQ